MKVDKNKVVVFDYVLRDKETGEVIDSSEQHGQPIKVLFGHGQIIPGLEERMMGMEPGEKKTIEVPAEEAYGLPSQELIQEVPREYFGDIELKEGLMLTATTPEGYPIDMKVVSFNDSTVVVDMNHPLAGKDLVFDVHVKEVRDASPEELDHGHAH
ncbi:MAG: peptidylprolyl isomerase [Chlorobi bacterium]|nr:peptidylprolyl isomerase [Chlorobiota bacterium]